MNDLLKVLGAEAPWPVLAVIAILSLLVPVALAWLHYRRERLQLEVAELRYRRERLWLEVTERLAHEHGPEVIDSLAALVHGPAPPAEPDGLPRARPPELPPGEEWRS